MGHKKYLYDRFTLTDLKPYPVIGTLMLLWRWVSLFSMNLSSQSKFPSLLLPTWDRFLYLVFFQEVLELYFKEGGLPFDKSSTIVKKTSSSLAMTSCLLTKITSQVFKYSSKKIAIRRIFPSSLWMPSQAWLDPVKQMFVSLLLGDRRSAETKTSKCASERTSLMQRKKITS